MEDEATVTEQGSSDSDFIPAEADQSGDVNVDLLNALNTLSDNLSEYEKQDLENFKALSKDFKEIKSQNDILIEQNEEIIAQQMAIINNTTYLVYLFICLLVGIVLHKVLSVINGA